MRTPLPSRLVPRARHAAVVARRPHTARAATAVIPRASSVAADTSTSTLLRHEHGKRHFAKVRDADKLLLKDVWFSSATPRLGQEDSSNKGPGFEDDKQPPDERTLNLGNTVRELHERLPTLLASPLPQDILSPHISLHLFPSTHPHLPTVSGRIAYMAALWSSPLAWGRIPLLGNVKLMILSERMVRNGGGPENDDKPTKQWRDEKLIVKWKTCSKSGKGLGGLYRGIGASEQADRIMDFLRGVKGEGADADGEEFTGIFIFEFDDEGRVVKHTIEHAEEGGNYDRMNRVVSVTEWLLGKVSGRRNAEHGLGLAWCGDEQEGRCRHARWRGHDR